MSPARATSSAVERWIPWRGRGKRRRNGGRERKGENENKGGGKRKGRVRRRKEGRRRGRRNTMKRLSIHGTKLWSPLAAVFLSQ